MVKILLVNKSYNRPFSIPSALQIAFPIDGPIVTPVNPPIKEPITPSSISPFFIYYSLFLNYINKKNSDTAKCRNPLITNTLAKIDFYLL